MKKFLFNLITYTLLLASILSFGYISLPEEIKAKIPQLTWLTSLITGASSGAIATTLLVVKSWLNKTDNENSAKIQELTKTIIELVNRQKQNEILVENITTLSNENKEVSENINEEIKRNNELLELSLLSKASNPFTSKEIVKLINEKVVLKNEENITEDN